MKQLLKDVVATEQLLKVNSTVFFFFRLGACCDNDFFLFVRDQETKVGVAVSKLRNHSSKEVVDLSKVIVKKWKGEIHVTEKPKPKPTSGNRVSLSFLFSSTDVLILQTSRQAFRDQERESFRHR